MIEQWMEDIERAIEVLMEWEAATKHERGVAMMNRYAIVYTKLDGTIAMLLDSNTGFPLYFDDVDYAREVAREGNTGDSVVGGNFRIGRYEAGEIEASPDGSEVRLHFRFVDDEVPA